MSLFVELLLWYAIVGCSVALAVAISCWVLDRLGVSRLAGGALMSYGAEQIYDGTMRPTGPDPTVEAPALVWRQRSFEGNLRAGEQRPSWLAAWWNRLRGVEVR